jgi:broad specificity phosphatase PhoE
MVICMRHGQTDWNTKGSGGDAEVLRGNIDVPLNAEGIREVYAVAEQLCAKYPVVEVRSTPNYLRDSVTRDIVAHVCGVPATDAPELDPYNVGNLSGQAVEGIVAIIDYLIDFPLIAPPGGETYAGFINEWDQYFHQCYEGEGFGGDDSRALVLIVHGNELRALPWVTERKPVTAYRHQRVKPSQYVVVH